MKKKFGYVIIIFCIFLISAGIYNNYAYNVEIRKKSYRLGVPDYAKGIKQDMEVTNYIRDKWNDHIGYVSGPDNLFGGTQYDANVVGAKLRSEILDWKREKDNIPFFSDFVLTAHLEVEDIPEAENLNDVLDYITNSINNLSESLLVNPNAESPILWVMWYLLSDNIMGWESTTGQTYWCFANASNAYNLALNYGINSTYANAIYAKNIDGYNLHRDLWWWTKDDFKKYPDVHRFDVPFLKDPEDWANTYYRLVALKSELLTTVGILTDAIVALNKSIEVLKTDDYANWIALNATLALVLNLGGIPLPPLNQGGDDLPTTFIMASLDPTGENWFQEGQKGLYSIFDQLGNQIPGKFGFLWQLLLEGLPVLTPVDKYLKKVADGFDIDGKTIETGIKGLDPSTQIIGDVSTRGNTIILKFEYADTSEKRDGWTVEFTYDEYGIQESVVFLDSEPFYEQVLLPSSLEQRIIPIFFGVLSIIAFSAIALVSVYISHKLRKRKAKKILKKYIEKKNSEMNE